MPWVRCRPRVRPFDGLGPTFLKPSSTTCNTQPQTVITGASSLPDADAETLVRSEACADYIRDRIRDAGGSLSFAEFMHHALYAPGLGYYTAGAAKFGADGDFVTAPEISPLFGRVLARQCAEILHALKGGAILEFGAGSGKLAADLLGALEALGAPPSTYRILEVSPDLAERQRRTLESRVPHLAGRVEWLVEPPTGHRGVVLANEVLDALPVERFRRVEQGVRQIRVVRRGAGLGMAEEPAPDILAAAVAGIESALGRSLPAGFVSEVCLAAPHWIGDLSGTLDRGVVLLFDYGVDRRAYYAPDRDGGWLRCHFRHHVHGDPLILPGVQDLTAWVDFTAVAGAAVDSGFELAGYLSQAQFLLNAGLDAELAEFANLPLASQLETSGQVKLLTLPGEMGENVKCLGLARGMSEDSSGFSRADRTHTL